MSLVGAQGARSSGLPLCAISGNRQRRSSERLGLPRVAVANDPDFAPQGLLKLGRERLLGESRQRRGGHDEDTLVLGGDPRYAERRIVATRPKQTHRLGALDVTQHEPRVAPPTRARSRAAASRETRLPAWIARLSPEQRVACTRTIYRTVYRTARSDCN